MSSFALKILGVLALIVDLVGDAYFPAAIIPRIIGRLALPIFAFLIVEGFRKTSNHKFYLYRLLIFAFLAEMPYDLFYSGVPVDLKSQNLLFTMVLGYVALCLFASQKDRSSGTMMLPLLCAMVATILKTQYSLFGVMLIFFIYPLGNEPKKLAISIGLVALPMTLPAFMMMLSSGLIANFEIFFLLTANMWMLLAVIPLSMYNGQLGRKSKRFPFYWSYPLVLLLLWACKTYIKYMPWQI